MMLAQKNMKKKGARKAPKRGRSGRGGFDTSLATADRPKSIVRMPANYLLPDQLEVTLRYTTELVYSPGVSAIQVFRGNSLFDPDQTGTGGQPMGFDQLKLLYGNYYVEWAECDFEYVSTSNAAVTLCLAPTLTTAPSGAELHDHPFAKTALMYGGTSNGRWGRLVSRARTIDLVNTPLPDTDLSADIGNNPVRQWYFVHRTHSTDSSTNISGCAFVRMSYRAIFFNRVDLSVSLQKTFAAQKARSHIVPAEVKEDWTSLSLDDGATRGDSKEAVPMARASLITEPTTPLVRALPARSLHPVRLVRDSSVINASADTTSSRQKCL